MFVAGVLAPLIFAACPAVEESRPSYRGELVVVHTDFGPVCAGTLAQFDEEIARIDAALGVDNSTYITEAWFLDDDEVAEACNSNHGGCAPNEHVYLVSALIHEFFAHEAVHTRVSPTGANSGKVLFVEGIAQALSRPKCYDEHRSFSSPDSYIEATNAVEFFNTDGYYLGGELVNWLLKTRGPEPVLEFMRTVGRHASPAEFRATYTSFFGGSLDEDLFGHLRPRTAEYEPWERGCAAPDARTDHRGNGYIFAESLDCESPRVQNNFLQLAFDLDDRAFVEWSITVTEANAGYFALTGETPENGGVLLYPCDCVRGSPELTVGVSPPPPPSNSALYPGEEILLSPNRYRVRWPGTFGDVLDVQLSPPCDIDLQDCPAGQQCTIWSRCKPEHGVLASPGESCELVDGVRTCESGSLCVNGTCVLECSPDHACPDGDVCGLTRLCGPACDLLAQDCGPELSCILSQASDGTGQCAPAGTGQLMDPCDRLDDVCASGLVCGSCRKGQVEGCCVPLCESNANCPADAPTCAFSPGNSVGVCV